MKKMSECLEEAADLLQETGWMQGRFSNVSWDAEKQEMIPSTAYCMIGACKEVCPERDFLEGSLGFALALGFTDASSAFNWNDSRAFTKEEVMLRLRANAKRLRRAEK